MFKSIGILNCYFKVPGLIRMVYEVGVEMHGTCLRTCHFSNADGYFRLGAFMYPPSNFVNNLCLCCS